MKDHDTNMRLSKTIDMMINAELDGLIEGDDICQLMVTMVNLQIKGGIVPKTGLDV